MDKQEKEVLRRIGRGVAELRERQNLSITALAARSGLDARLIEQVESGELDFEVTVIFALAAGLGVSPRELLKSL